METQYKKSKNVVANGFKLMLAHNDVNSIAHLPIFSECANFTDLGCVSTEFKKSFSIIDDSQGGLSADNLPNDYAIVNREDKSPFSWSKVPYIFALTDGMTYGVISGKELASLDVFVDVNTNNNPNTVKKDLYKYRLSGNGFLQDVSDELEKINPDDIDYNCLYPSGNCTRQMCDIFYESGAFPCKHSCHGPSSGDYPCADGSGNHCGYYCAT